MAFAFVKPINFLGRQFVSRSILKAKLPNIFCAATLTSKELKGPDYQRAKPFPYEKKRFTFFHWYIDSTLKRFDDNSKIIVIDGNIGAGKTTLAKQVAEAFDLVYFPEPDFKEWYTTPYGLDLRPINEFLPPSYKICDFEEFYKNPHGRNVAGFQFRMLTSRFKSYLDAVRHLLNTGQGVVLDRCVFSDFVFMDAMAKAGYVRKEAHEYYMDLYESVTHKLLMPHLIVYLDISVDTALQRIKERNRPMEVNSKVLTRKYLQDIEDSYKKQYLKDYGKHCEVFTIDWDSYGDVEVVIDDLHDINLDDYPVYEEKFRQWRKQDDWSLGWERYQYTTQQQNFLNYLQVFRHDVPEVLLSVEDQLEMDKLQEKIPGMKYAHGFNENMGDSILFKSEPARNTKFTPYLREL